MHALLTVLLVTTLSSPTQTGAAPLDLYPAAAIRVRAPPTRYLAESGAMDADSMADECRFRRRGPFMLLAAGGVQTFGALGYALAEYDHRHGGNGEEYAFSAGFSIMALIGGTAFALVSGTLLAKDAVAWRSCRQGR